MLEDEKLEEERRRQMEADKQLLLAEHMAMIEQEAALNQHKVPSEFEDDEVNDEMRQCVAGDVFK